MRADTVAGWLLVLSVAPWFSLLAIDNRIWARPFAERLAMIAERPRAWQFVNVCIAAASVLLVLGFVASLRPLEAAGAGVLAPLSIAAIAIGCASWLVSLAFRVSTLPAAGDAASVDLLRSWAGGLFYQWAVLANVAAVGLGAAAVHAGHPSAWGGWLCLAFGALLLLQLATTGDALPVTYHLGPLALGVAFLTA